MTTVLVPPPPRVDLVEITKDRNGDFRGRITRPWSLYLDDIFTRLGGNVAPSTTDLTNRVEAASEAASSATLGVFGRQIQMPQKPTPVAYMGAFLPRHVPAAQRPSDANNVICDRVFARR